MGIGDLENAFIRDTDTKDISREIFQGLFSRSDGLGMYIPSGTPLFGVDAGTEIQGLDQLSEFTAEDL